MKYIDIQVNGYAGIDFSSLELTSEGIDLCVEKLMQAGTAGFLATVITSSDEIYNHVIPLLVDGCIRHEEMLGIHLEGPFISNEKGYSGAHNPNYILSPSKEYFDKLFNLCKGHLKILTFAPELEGAIDLIKYAKLKNITVAAGHSNAAEKDIELAVSAGLDLATHLGNGCPKLMDRHDNYLWPLLSESKITASIITDGFHLKPSVIKTMLQAKGLDKIIIVSDSAPCGGKPPGNYKFQGMPVTIHESGLLTHDEFNCLAGSSSCIKDCVEYIKNICELSDEDIKKIAYENPLKMIG